MMWVSGRENVLPIPVSPERSWARISKTIFNMSFRPDLNPDTSDHDARSVHMFHPLYREDEVLSEIKDCLLCGWTGDGYKTVEFETQWSEFSGFSFSHFTNSSTSGLFLCLELLRDLHGWSSEVEVITTPITFVSTNHAILNAGLTPVFADVDDTLNVDPESVKRLISPKTVAILFVGIGGNSANYKAIREICSVHGLKLILDAAHMAGTRMESRHVGLDSDLTVFSFQAVKNLPICDAGMICTNNLAISNEIKNRIWLGISKTTYDRSLEAVDDLPVKKYKWEYDVLVKSNKYNGNSIAASIGIVGLRYLDIDNAYRRYLAETYMMFLSELEIKGYLSFVKHANPLESSRHLCQVILCSQFNRNHVIAKLNEKGVYPGVHYITNLSYPLYHPYDRGHCINATRVSDAIISLPIHLRMNKEDVLYVANQLSSVLHDLILAPER